jgi:glycosyltransferase involved in cell wall biosynthesis
MDLIPASVVIPAHNEESTIGRTLRSLLEGSAPGELEVIVVCNGCTDATASVARSVSPPPTVAELPQPSKVAALNEGDRLATRFPRLYVDADIEMGIEATRAVIALLASGGALCAAPLPDYDCSLSSRAVGRYYEIWRQLPYFNEDPMGCGVYGLSEAGRARFDTFPELIADDEFVLEQFDRTERKSLSDHTFRVHPPLDARTLTRTRTRAYRGNRQLAQSGLSRFPPAAGAQRGLARLARHPGNWSGIGSYVSITMVAKLRARTKGLTWERDNSSRTGSSVDPSAEAPLPVPNTRRP